MSVDIDIDEQLPEHLLTPENLQLESVLIPIINQVAIAPFDFVLVLDDYHLIHHQDIHDALAFFLDNLPPPMHLIIVSRSDPPIPLARLRAQGQLTEIRAAQLGFSLADGETFLNQIKSLNLSQASIQTLIERTDGWVAALQMVSIALQGKSDVSDYIQEVTGNQDYIADFLTEEVIQQQPIEIQDFILKTSMLDRLSGPLCTAVTGREDSQKILKQLKEANIFLMPLDDHSQWFRYHRLFADLLLQRLNQSQAELLPGLCFKASKWFEANEFPDEAIEYAFRGQHIEMAAAIIDREGTTTLSRSEIATFIRWVEQLPDQVIFARESLCIDYAWALLVSGGESATAEKFLNQVATTNNQLIGRLNAVKSILAFYQKRPSEAVELAHLAFGQIPEDDLFYRHIAAWNLSATLFINGDTTGGIKMLKESARISLASNNLLVAIVSLCRLGSYYLETGEFNQAEAYFRQALAVKPENQIHPLPAACEALFGLGRLAWEREELDAASQYIQDGLQLSKRWRATAEIGSYIILAHLNQSLEDAESASKYIRTAQNIARQTTATDTDDKFVASHAALLALRQGDLDAVEQWTAAQGLAVTSHLMNFEELQQSGAEVILRYELIVFARYLLATKRENEALALLGKLLPSLLKLGHHGKVLEGQMLQSLGLQAQGKMVTAVAIISDVLLAAERAGYKRLFIDEGLPMARLIKSALERGLDSKFAHQLLDRFARQPEISPPPKGVPVWIETLSKREIEILRLLTSDRPVPDIAIELHIAVSTLRTHIKNIYSKLGVHSRFEAVMKGQDLGII